MSVSDWFVDKLFDKAHATEWPVVFVTFPDGSCELISVFDFSRCSDSSISLEMCKTLAKGKNYDEMLTRLAK